MLDSSKAKCANDIPVKVIKGKSNFSCRNKYAQNQLFVFCNNMLSNS